MISTANGITQVFFRGLINGSPSIVRNLIEHIKIHFKKRYFVSRLKSTAFGRFEQANDAYFDEKAIFTSKKGGVSVTSDMILVKTWV